MNADFRVTEIFTEEETGDVIALCYDVLYGETFEKFLGQGDEYDGKENASNLLKDPNYEISPEIRDDIEDIFGVKEFDAENGYTDSYQFYDFGEDDFEEEEVAMATESFSLREALNKIDWDTDNKYDLLNLYEACNLSENEKRALANIVYDQNDPSVIYDTLNDRFLGKEIEMPERVKDGVIHEDVSNLSEEEIYDRVVNYLDNHPYDFDRDRLDAEDICDEIAANLFGVDYFNVDGKVSHAIFNAVNNYFEELDEITNDFASKSLTESTKTFSQWFDETQRYGDDEEFYTFDNYIKKFPNAEVLKDATAEDIKNNAHRFYDIYEVDSVDREKAFNFASELLGLDYDVFYDAWLSGSPVPGTNLDESKSIKESFSNFDAVDEFCNAVNAKLGVDAFRHSFGGMVSFDKHQFVNKEIFNSMRTDNSVIGETLTELGYVYDDKEDAYIKGNLYVFIPARGSQSHSVQFFEYEPKSIKEGADEFEFDDEFNAYYDGYTKEDEDENSSANRLKKNIVKESTEDEPYTKEQIEQDLKSITHNFTDKEGELKCGFEEEKNFGVEILKKYYKVVETSGDDRRDATWYHISFAEPIEK